MELCQLLEWPMVMFSQGWFSPVNTLFLALKFYWDEALLCMKFIALCSLALSAAPFIFIYLFIKRPLINKNDGATDMASVAFIGLKMFKGTDIRSS